MAHCTYNILSDGDHLYSNPDFNVKKLNFYLLMDTLLLTILPHKNDKESQYLHTSKYISWVGSGIRIRIIMSIYPDPESRTDHSHVL
jgi:hypothetical protein